MIHDTYYPSSLSMSAAQTWISSLYGNYNRHQRVQGTTIIENSQLNVGSDVQATPQDVGVPSYEDIAGVLERGRYVCVYVNIKIHTYTYD